MNTEYADAVVLLDERIEEACNIASSTLTTAEIAAELRRIAEEWEEEA